MGKGHGDRLFTPDSGNQKGKGHGDRLFMPGTGKVERGQVMATAYAWYWQFNTGEGHYD